MIVTVAMGWFDMACPFVPSGNQEVHSPARTGSHSRRQYPRRIFESLITILKTRDLWPKWQLAVDRRSDGVTCENRDLQCEQRECAAAGAAPLARRNPARRGVSPRTQGPAGQVPLESR